MLNMYTFILQPLIIEEELVSRHYTFYLGLSKRICFDLMQVSCSSNSSFSTQTFTGADLPPPLSIPSCSNILLQFFTDDSDTGPGFSLRYDIYSGKVCTKFISIIFYSLEERIILLIALVKMHLGVLKVLSIDRGRFMNANDVHMQYYT